MKIAVLGPGGVGGLLAGALHRAGEQVTVVAREPTAEAIAERGVRVSSVTLGDFTARPRAVAELGEPVDALIVATKAAGLPQALRRIECAPALVLPLLNGLDHVALLRERFAAGSVLAGTIRVEADRPAPGVVVHTSPFLLVEMATREAPAREPMQALAQALTDAGVKARADWPVGERSEAQVMWSKLVRLNALACTTSAYDKLLGEIRSTPSLRADLQGAIAEACAVGQAEGADVDPQKAIGELERAHETLGSSMQRDIAAGRTPEIDAIPGSVLRAGKRHGIDCPTIERLVATILARIESRAG
ncbi:MAG TPA: 2-dehydropantoate 2-reductase [Solirubrobacteraceae bacterium]|jgi:2-dehydropantoate 2-reductase|nr:2-dehydropantoate 2-reductase [Solirubrobacteraceae bacterium]